jgi:methionyl-tRNA formyltransferase
VKKRAVQLHLPVLQPEKLSAPEAMSTLSAWHPDVIVVAAFGQILRPDALVLAPFGCINLHASLLPRHRGAAPIPAAILSGDAVTGITLMKMDPGVDTGPILAQKSVPILPGEDSADLSHRLARLAAEVLRDQLPVYIHGDLKPVPQDASLATYAPRLKKRDGMLDPNRPAEELERRVRAYHPWPGAFFLLDGKPFKILRARVAQKPVFGQAGSAIVVDRYPAIQTANGTLILQEVQPAGRKPMAGDVFLRGAKDFAGKIVSVSGG